MLVREERFILSGLLVLLAPLNVSAIKESITGYVLDIAVDIRKNSPTYGEHVSIELNEENKTMFYIPPGFAHGFVTLCDNTIFSYKCTQVYNKESEGTVLWNDLDLSIDWKTQNPLLSDKDIAGTIFKDFKSPF